MWPSRVTPRAGGGPRGPRCCLFRAGPQLHPDAGVGIRRHSPGRSARRVPAVASRARARGRSIPPDHSDPAAPARACRRIPPTPSRRSPPPAGRQCLPPESAYSSSGESTRRWRKNSANPMRITTYTIADRDDRRAGGLVDEEAEEDQHRDRAGDHSTGDAPWAAVRPVRVGELPAQDHEGEHLQRVGDHRAPDRDVEHDCAGDAAGTAQRVDQDEGDEADHSADHECDPRCLRACR